MSSPGETWEPDDEDLQLTPPHIRAPLYECAERATVESLVSNAVAYVIDESDRVIGKGTANPNGRVFIDLERPVEAHEELRAVQQANGQESDLSDKRVVEEYPHDALPRQTIPEVWECSGVVQADGVIPGPELLLERNDPDNVVADASPSASSRSGWWPIRHDALPEGSLPATVRTRQVHCPDTDYQIQGPVSDWYEAEPAPSPMPQLDVDENDVYAGDESVRVRDALIGSYLTIQQQSDVWGSRDATNDSVVVYGDGGDVIENEQSLGFTQELCEESEPVEVMPRPEEDLTTIGPPDVREPICPETSAVKVRPAHSSARIGVSLNDGDSYHVNTGDGASMVSVHQWDLEDGDELSFYHVFEGDEENQYSESAVVEVKSVDALEIHDSETYDHQNGGEVEGFVRETARGPEIVLHCCADCENERIEEGQCYLEDGDGNLEPRTVLVRVVKEGIAVDTVALFEEYPGQFVGRWDWFMEDGPDGLDQWPPSPSLDYEVVLRAEENPCEKEFIETFDVLIGEPDPDDDTPPELAELSISDGENNSVTVDQDDSNETLDVVPGDQVDVNVSGYDPDGLFRVEVEETGGEKLNSPTNNEADPDVVPIPPDLSLSTSLDSLDPYEQTMLSATALNFNTSSGETETPFVELTGEHAEPYIEEITPSEVYSSVDNVTISGEHLRYSTLETTVHFELEQPGDEPPITSEKGISDTGGSHEELSDVEIPEDLQDNFGTVTVTITTENADDPDQFEESNSETFMLLDRDQGDFQEYEYSDFFTNDASAPDCSNAGYGAISTVDIEETDPNEYQLIVESDDRDGPGYDVLDNFEAYESSGDPTIGGVVVGPNCRTVAVLSLSSVYGDPDDDEPRFRFGLYYFPTSTDDDIVEQTQAPRDIYVDEQGTWKRYTNPFRLFIGQDDTIVTMTGPTVNTTSFPDHYETRWRFADLLLDRDNTNNDSACDPETVDCEFGTRIEGSVIYIERDGDLDYDNWDLSDDD